MKGTNKTVIFHFIKFYSYIFFRSNLDLFHSIDTLGKIFFTYYEPKSWRLFKFLRVFLIKSYFLFHHFLHVEYFFPIEYVLEMRQR